MTNEQPEKGNKAVTIIIIVVVVIGLGIGSMFVLGIVAAIALPNFIGAQDKARSASVKSNMRTYQICAESYAVDHDGIYPNTVDELKPLLPADHAPINPYSAETDPAVLGSVTDVAEAREVNPETVTLAPGVVEYSPIKKDGATTSYAIRGGDKEGHAIEGRTAGKSLVLSNN